MRFKRRQPTTADVESYDDYLVHPRYGQGPRITGCNPPQGSSCLLFFFSILVSSDIPNTAIKADVDRQKFRSVPKAHYFDERRVCRDCRRKFIFFAEEQKYWYEEIGFPIEATAVRCVECRNIQQGIGRLASRYVELMGWPNRTTEQSLEMAACCLSLIESGTFNRRQTSHVRQILNTTSPGWKTDPGFAETLTRLKKLEEISR